MKINGEYIFETFEEAFQFVNAPTTFEKEHNIIIVNTNIVVDTSDFKIVLMKKSDNTTTMFLFFKNSKSKEIWKFWCPSKEQIPMLLVAYGMYYAVENKNLKERVYVK